MKSALERIRNELGSDALILETRKSNDGSGWIEVMAALPHSSVAGPETGSSIDFQSLGRSAGVSPSQVYRESDGRSAAPQPPLGSAGMGGGASEEGSVFSKMAQILSQLPNEQAGRPEATIPPAPPTLDVASDDDYDDEEYDDEYDDDEFDDDEYDDEIEYENDVEYSDQRTEVSVDDAIDRSEVGAELDLDSELHEKDKERIEYLGRLVRSEHFSVIPLPLRELYLDLADAELDSNLVFKILSKLGTSPMPGQFSSAPPDEVLAVVRKLVETGGTVEAISGRNVMALVGPTGVGKTTTVAKIAGHAAFRLKKSVALISTDSYRVFGAQHLGSYAALMGIPFAACDTADAIRAQLEGPFADHDLVLIDTSGRSPRDPDGIAEIHELLETGTDVALHLVLSATSRVKDMALALDSFALLPVRHLLFTKLDEATRSGGIVTLAMKAKMPVSYLGTGQEVPDDLEIATEDRLIETILEGMPAESDHV